MTHDFAPSSDMVNVENSSFSDINTDQELPHGKSFAFDKFGLDKALIKSIKNEGFTVPTPIQDLAILPLMSGCDLMGIAQTGSGKTAAFSLPLINKIMFEYARPQTNMPKALILAPTRELVMQIGQFIDKFSRGTQIKSLVIAGGQPYAPQIRKLKYGVDILISTPGRLIDHMQRGTVKFDDCATFILDEADRMLDMGFIDDVNEIGKTLAPGHQTVLFSATMNPKVRKLASELLNDPEYVEQKQKTAVADTITHKLMNVRRKNKSELLIELLKDEAIDKALVFARTKIGADDICDELKIAFRDTDIRVDAIHGDKKQRTREKILLNFRKGRTKVLVATDVAARGIDVDGITHVINYELPIEAENYIHRVGRTGRAGQTGIAISFCDPSDKRLLKEIEHLIKIPILVDTEHEFHFDISDIKDFKKGRSGNRERSSGRERGSYNDRSSRPDRKSPNARRSEPRKSEGRSDTDRSNGWRPEGNDDNKRPESREFTHRTENKRSDAREFNHRSENKSPEGREFTHRKENKRSEGRNFERKRQEGRDDLSRHEGKRSETKKPSFSKQVHKPAHSSDAKRYDPWKEGKSFDDDPVLQKLRGPKKRTDKTVERGGNSVTIKPKKNDVPIGKRPKKNAKPAGKRSSGNVKNSVKQTGGNKTFAPKRKTLRPSRAA